MNPIAYPNVGFIAALIAALAGCVHANAPAVIQVDRSITVPYRGLNLARSSDVAALYHRIQVAAARLCGPREMGGPDIESTLYADCVTDAVARATATVDRPALTAYHISQIAR